MSMSVLVAVSCAIGLVEGQAATGACRPDAEWDKVLALGTGGPDSLEQLTRLAKRNDGQPSTRLAGVMVTLWNKARGTFETSTPRTVCRPTVSQDALRRVVPGQVNAKTMLVEATVTPRGTVAAVSIPRTSGYPELDALVLARAKEALFCPVKSSARYSAGSITLMFRLEVR